MNETELLKYGFVVFLKGEATYDHVVKAKLPYANSLIEELQSAAHPIIAQRYYPSDDASVSSPLFRYISPKSGIGSYQSAYYLADALMRKDVLPVYIRATGEVKDLMPLLNEEQKQDAKLAIQILRARYIKADKRRPSKGFMIKGDFGEVDAATVELSDADILKIFGRLPTAPQENVVKLHQSEVNADGTAIDFIEDEVAYRA